jgi:hypothetical protein
MMLAALSEPRAAPLDVLAVLRWPVPPARCLPS